MVVCEVSHNPRQSAVEASERQRGGETEQKPFLKPQVGPVPCRALLSSPPLPKLRLTFRRELSVLSPSRPLLSHLCSGIVGLSRVADETHDGRDVDDAALALLEHELASRLGDVKHPAQVQVDNLKIKKRKNVKMLGRSAWRVQRRRRVDWPRWLG